MKLDKFNQWLSLVANFGVVAGIVFLAVEIRQNQESLEEANTLNRLSASTAALDYNMNQRHLFLENQNLLEIWIRGRKGDVLNEIEQAQFDYLCSNVFWSNSTIHERYLILENFDGAHATALDMSELVQAYPGIAKCYFSLEQDMKNYGFSPFVLAVQDLINN